MIVRKFGQDKLSGSNSGVAVGVNHNVYVSDEAHHCVYAFDGEGRFLYQWGRKGYGDGEFQCPSPLALGTCAGMNACVLEVMQSVYPLYALPPGLLPLCAAYYGAECLYVADWGTGRIQVFQLVTSTNASSRLEAKFLKTFGGAGRGDDRFSTISGCTVGVDGNVYVSDRAPGFVKVFDPLGNFIQKWSAPTPTKIFSDSSGLLYAFNQNFEKPQILCYQPDGKLVRQWVSPPPYRIACYPGFYKPYNADAVHYVVRNHGCARELLVYKLEPTRDTPTLVRVIDDFRSDIVATTSAVAADLFHIVLFAPPMVVSIDPICPLTTVLSRRDVFEE